MVKQTAGRDKLGEFAPKFAEINDDVLFGEVWSREDKLSLRDRSLVTVVALMSQGLVDSSFKYHLMSAKNNGITKEEIAEIIEPQFPETDLDTILCRMAKSLGSFQYGKRGLDRRIKSSCIYISLVIQLTVVILNLNFYKGKYYEKD